MLNNWIQLNLGRMAMRATGNERGITLIELMIVIVVVSILATIAYPSYEEHVRKAKRAEGQAALVSWANRMEKYAYDNGANGYKDAVAKDMLGDPDGDSTAETENEYYTLVFAAGEPTATTYVLQAVPQAPFSDSGCQTLTLNQAGVKGVTNGATKSKEQCW